MKRSKHPRRGQPRADLDVYINKIIGDEPHLARVRDISPTGVFLHRLLEPEVPSDFPVGLEIKLPNSMEVIWAVAIPMRRELNKNSDGVAYHFTRIAESDKEIIREYVDVFAKDQSLAARAA